MRKGRSRQVHEYDRMRGIFLDCHLGFPTLFPPSIQLAYAPTHPPHCLASVVHILDKYYPFQLFPHSVISLHRVIRTNWARLTDPFVGIDEGAFGLDQPRIPLCLHLSSDSLLAQPPFHLHASLLDTAIGCSAAYLVGKPPT